MKRITKIAVAVGAALTLGLGAAAVSAQPYGYGMGPGMMGGYSQGYGPGYGMGPGMMGGTVPATAWAGAAGTWVATARVTAWGLRPCSTPTRAMPMRVLPR